MLPHVVSFTKDGRYPFQENELWVKRVLVMRAYISSFEQAWHTPTTNFRGKSEIYSQAPLASVKTFSKPTTRKEDMQPVTFNAF